MRLVRRIITVLVSSLVVWLGLAMPPAAAEAPTPPRPSICTYDGSLHQSTAPTNTTERGPPAAYDYTTYDAAGRWSHGGSVRPHGPTTPATTAYPVAAVLARGASATTTAGSRGVVVDGVLSAFERWRVAAKSVPATNKIYSNRALQRMADEPGPLHNFPAPFDETVFSQGTRTVNPGYFNKAKPNLGNDSIQYRLPGVINGRSGVYEIFTRPSTSGRTEMIIHRFFRPDY